MAETTGISWTGTPNANGEIIPGATFNPWIGCHRVSPGCGHCYAADLAQTRLSLDVWDDKQVKPRYMIAESTWKQPRAWNRKAEKLGVRIKVFCASMADVFEDHPDIFKMRIRLWRLIEETPHLDWLILTKRPENVTGMVPWRRWPGQVWLGTSVENQHFADIRIPQLLQIPAKIRFLSCEPLLGAVDLSTYMTVQQYAERREGPPFQRGIWPDGEPAYHHVARFRRAIDWVIVGGESGPKHRPMQLDWARAIRDQCAVAEVPYFFKQIGGKTSKSGGDLLDGRQYHEWPRGNAA